MSVEFNAGESIVTLDRRRGNQRSGDAAAVAATAKAPAANKRRKERRRQIDPTTCERDYSNDEVEFMTAMDSYKRRSGRMFPTCSEILEVIRDLGYKKD